MKEIICPHCKNTINDEDALLCHFCGESLSRASSGALGKIRGSWKWFFIAVALIITMSFLLSFY